MRRYILRTAGRDMSGVYAAESVQKSGGTADQETGQEDGMKGKTRVYDQEACTGCLFRCAEGTCDFALITGRARSGICPPGKECTVRVKTERAYYARCREYMAGAIPPPPGGRSHKNRFDESRAWQMYSVEKLNDREMAKRLGVETHVIYNWRKRNALETNYRRK